MKSVDTHAPSLVVFLKICQRELLEHSGIVLVEYNWCGRYLTELPLMRRIGSETSCFRSPMSG